MALILALILAMVFLVLSAVHLYWAAGGRWGLDGSIPTQDGVPLFSPGRMLTLLVAAVLLGAALLSLWRAGVPNIGPVWVPRTAVWVIAVAFAGRAVGDFRYCGFFKRVKTTAFARNDTLIFSPLCAVVSALAVCLSLAN